MKHDLRGSMVLSVQRILINSLPLMSKGEEKQKQMGGFYKKNKGRVLSSMPKGEIVGNVVIDGKGIGKEGASEIVTSNREKKFSREQRSVEKNRERVHLQRVVSVKEQIEFSRKDI